MLTKTDIFNDDPTIPAETIIRNSRFKAFTKLLLGIAFLGVSIWLFIQGTILTFATSLLGIAILILGLSDLRDREPKMIINNEGLEAGNASFYNWNEITNENFSTEISNKNWYTYLNYTCPEGVKRINLSDLDISKARMKKLIFIYRTRYNKVRDN